MRKSFLTKIKQQYKIKKHKRNKTDIYSIECPSEYKLKKNGTIFYVNWSKEVPIWICRITDFVNYKGIQKVEFEVLNETVVFSEPIIVLKDLKDVNLFKSYVDACKFIYHYTRVIVDKDFYQ